MIQFSRLRLNGFKSFVDRTELEIGPGLNGVVGPNGCGKSNLVEALRWVMGETSAKRMRGGGMEDVIFSGTEKRSPRNIAEVSLLLDNDSRTAPSAYNGLDEIEIVRRIEKDRGSHYKINGKHARAKDVQILFADTVTGANSPAMVSQGRVTQIINAKPLDRRMILEESAGISGLYARRHEAELRLKAADANLTRMEDILGSLENRLAHLKRQAKQAARYRNIGSQIRQFEILIAYMEWKDLETRLTQTKEKFNAAESIVVEKLGAVTQLTKTQTVQSQDLPGLRRQEADSAARLQTQKLVLQRLEDDTARREEQKKEIKQQLEQTTTDRDHETQSLKEYAQNIERLEEEQKALLTREEGADQKLAGRQKEKNELEEKVTALEEQYRVLMETSAESKARKKALEETIAQNTRRIEVIGERKRKAQAELTDLKENHKDFDRKTELQNQSQKLEATITETTEEIENLSKKTPQLKEQVGEVREILKNAESQFSELTTEMKTLESFIMKERTGEFLPILDAVVTDKGFEKALSRALGDTLMASLEDDAPSRWTVREASFTLPDLPEGVSPIGDHVQSPKELQLALSQIGFVETEEAGETLSEALKPGQSLVSGNGSYWRWDGYIQKAEASDRNALHLEQKNRLAVLTEKKPATEKALAEAQEALKAAQGTYDQAEQKQNTLRSQLRTMQESLKGAHRALQDIEQKTLRFESEKKRLDGVIEVADEDIEATQKVLKADRLRLDTLLEAESADQERETEELREKLQSTRENYREAIRAFDSLQQEGNARKARLHGLADERINLQNRSIRSRERMKELEDRLAVLTDREKTMEDSPKDSETKRQALLETIASLETERSDIADKIASVEQELAETAKALKEAESALSEARESRAHAQATTALIQEQKEKVEQDIRERFESAPHQLPDQAALDMDKEWGDLESLRQKKETLTRQRDSIGAVNLQAEEELKGLEQEATGLLHERNDLVEAVEELRGGIRKINAEAAERLVLAFERVNAHFQDLFKRLFGGGQAHLKLLDSNDPLETGLEIYAQPPGKTLQSLSLLSGGEQTLTSIALIFAMFLTNPSPICVLDEIDAPLDDANVDRVCDLLEEIAERGETRFLIITHHRMTMARMDRLYGVTMVERGVSQLVSVDLQQSFDFIEPGHTGQKAA